MLSFLPVLQPRRLRRPRARGGRGVILIAFQVLRRAAQYGIAGPAREVLFTVRDREDKYKAKNFIDTAVSRGGDALSGWAFAGLIALGLGMAGVALVALPLAAAWIAWPSISARREEGLRARA